MATGRTIGETNGLWGYLFKFQLAMVPFVMAWVIWISLNQVLDNSFRNLGPRFTEATFQNKTDLIVSRLEPRLVRIETQLETQSQVRPADVYALVETLTKEFDLRFDALEKQIKANK